MYSLMPGGGLVQVRGAAAGGGRSEGLPGPAARGGPPAEIGHRGVPHPRLPAAEPQAGDRRRTGSPAVRSVNQWRMGESGNGPGGIWCDISSATDTLAA